MPDDPQQEQAPRSSKWLIYAFVAFVVLGFGALWIYHHGDKGPIWGLLGK